MKQIFFAALLLVAGPAYSLSCLPPNMARSFNWAVEAEETYGVFVGQLKATEEIKNPNKNRSGPIGISWSVETEFSGKMLGRRGLGKAQSFPVSVNVTCLASWCGGYADSEKDQIFFLQKTETGYRWETGPCDGYAPDGDVSKNLGVLQKCLRRGKCSRNQIKSLEMTQ